METGRIKLKPKHGLRDWMRYHQENRNLKGFEGPPRRTISVSELRMHCTESDCWMAYMGKVYNITPYLDYHPGGIPEIMRAAGADGTALFDQTHRWVNFANMLSNCYVGDLVANSRERGGKTDSKTQQSSSRPNSLSLDYNPPALTAPRVPSVPVWGTSSSNFVMGRVEQVVPHTHDSYLIRLRLSAPISVAIAGHVQIKANVLDPVKGHKTMIMRPYTPIAPRGVRSVSFLTRLDLLPSL